MMKAIERSIINLSLEAASSTTHDEAMKYSQAVLNLTHALSMLERIEKGTV